MVRLNRRNRRFSLNYLNATADTHAMSVAGLYEAGSLAPSVAMRIRSRRPQLQLLRRRLIELRQIEAATLLFFHDFQPHFELFQAAS